jgi:hypothetical protein
MRRAVTVFGILALAASVMAGQAAQSGQTGKKDQTKIEKSARAATPAPKSATGKIDKFENNVLTVTTKNGAENFAVGPQTVIAESGKKMDSAALKAGENVKVRYTEAGGTMTATHVTISKPVTHTTAKKSEKK